jgi:hypothetical protein
MERGQMTELQKANLKQKLEEEVSYLELESHRK